MTNVTNLCTMEVQFFTCEPERAVVCAYEQSRGNYNSWDYDYSQARVSTSGKTVICGDFCATTQWYNTLLYFRFTETFRRSLRRAGEFALIIVCDAYNEASSPSTPRTEAEHAYCYRVVNMTRRWRKRFSLAITETESGRWTVSNPY